MGQELVAVGEGGKSFSEDYMHIVSVVCVGSFIYIAQRRRLSKATAVRTTTMARFRAVLFNQFSTGRLQSFFCEKLSIP